jgi:hypothetical protein
MEEPATDHWAAVKHLLRYIAGTLHYGCKYKRSTGEPLLLGYSDADFAGDVDDRKSTSGMIFRFKGNTICWQSQKQKVVALSSCEAEYMGATAAACQGVWLQRMIGDLLGGTGAAATLLIDNQSAIQLCKNPVYHDRTKHIDTRFHYIRECVQNGKINVDYVHTSEQLADIMTKALPRVKFQELRGKMGVINISS